MQIFEVKNDTAEIIYACNEEKLYLFDFLFIEDEELTIVSQVTNISSTENENENIATVKFCLSVDKNNRLTKYNGHTPNKNSEVGYLDASEIIGLFRPKTNAVNWGEYVRNKTLTVSTDLKFLSSGFCTVCDKTEQAEAIVKTLISSLETTNTRTLVLDFDGKYQNIKTTNNAVYGKEYRIPLDSRALDYIFENDLDDCTPDVKVVIQNIILEIQKYIESVEKGFIPFEMFLQIVVSETKRTANTGLLAFCNKLLNYKYKKIFADKESQFSIIDNCNGSFKLDLSTVDEKFYPLLFGSVISRLYKKFYVIADITEENVQSSTMRSIYEKQNVRLLPIISHDNKYLNKIKSHCNNFAVFAPVEKIKNTEFYNDIVEKLQSDEFVLYGENSLFVPLLISAKKQIENKGQAEEDVITLADLDDLDKANLELVKQLMKQEELEKDALTVSEDDLNDLEELYHPEVFVQEKELLQRQSISSEEKEEKSAENIDKKTDIEEVVKEVSDKEISEDVEIIENNENAEEKRTILSTTEIVEVENLEKVENVETVETVETMPISEASETPEMVEQNDIEQFENTQMIIEDNQSEEEEIVEELQNSENDEIVENVEDSGENSDSLDEYETNSEEDLTEEIPENAENKEDIEPVSSEQEENVKEEIQENIEEQSSVEETEQPAKAQEKPVQKSVQKEPPMIRIEKSVEPKVAVQTKPLPRANELPVYEPKETASKQAETADFAEGMRVSHAKYGAGTVEKIIKYGKKTLCSIQFDTFGRRLLDPNITTIEKL